MGKLRMVGSKPMIKEALGGLEAVEPKGGHTTLEWGPTADVSAEQAEEVFRRLQVMSFKGYEMEGSVGTPIKEFNPEAETITLMAPMAGGRL